MQLLFGVGNEPGQLLLASISEARMRSQAGAARPPAAIGLQFASAANFKFRGIPTLLDAPASTSSFASLQIQSFDISRAAQLQQRQRRLVASVARSLNRQARRLSFFLNNQLHAHLAVLHTARASMAQQVHHIVQLRNRLFQQHPLHPGGLRDGGGRGGGATRSERRLKQQVRLHVEQASAAERALDLQLAVHHLEQAAALDPTNPEWQARLSKQWSDMTYLPELSRGGGGGGSVGGGGHSSSKDALVELHRRAIEAAEKAIALAPGNAMGHGAACISRGRLAVVSDNRTKAQLAKQAQHDARMALQLDPRNDLAHHLAGRWHYEMAGLNVVVRTLIQLLFGASLQPGTYQEALQSFSLAAELAPHKLIHRVELGRTHAKLGNVTQAVAELTSAVTSADLEDINAVLQHRFANQVLAEYRATGRLRVD